MKSSRHFTLICFSMFFLSPLTAAAADITLSWQPSLSAGVDHYVVYWGTSPGDYPFSSRDKGDRISADTTSYTVTGLSESLSYHFAVKAVSADGTESLFSNEAARPSITFPATGSSVPVRINVSGTAAARSAVHLYSGAMLLGTGTATDKGLWSISANLDAPSGTTPVQLTAVSTGAASFPVAVYPSAEIEPSDLSTAIRALQVVTGIEPAGLSAADDLNQDGYIGLQDAVYALRNASGI